jgi:hypothetical protein
MRARLLREEAEREEQAATEAVANKRALWANVEREYKRATLNTRVKLDRWIVQNAKALKLPDLELEPKDALALLRAGRKPARLEDKGLIT